MNECYRDENAGSEESYSYTSKSEENRRGNMRMDMSRLKFINWDCISHLLGSDHDSSKSIN